MGEPMAPRLIFDLGGGSLEITLLHAEGVERSFAFPLGTVRLMESMGLSDRMTREQQRAVRDRVLATLVSAWPDPPELADNIIVGCGGNAEPLARITAGALHTCALGTTGAAYCWGDGTSGQLGDGATASSDVPVPVAGGHRFTAITAGAYYTCALDTTGRPWCWGAGLGGQLGDGTLEERDTPVPVSTSMRFASLSLGDSHTCGRTREGAIYCWGDNSSGQLGDGSGAKAWPVPVLVRW